MSWFNWAEADADLIEFTRRLIQLRRNHGAFQRTKWPIDRPSRRSLAGLAWFNRDGVEMTQEDWDNPETKSFALYLDDRAPGALPPDASDRFYLLFNANIEPQVFQTPSSRWGRLWQVVLDTSTRAGFTESEPPLQARDQTTRPGLSLLVLHCPRRASDSIDR